MARRLAATPEIGHVLETIGDEAGESIPQLEEVCLPVVEGEPFPPDGLMVIFQSDEQGAASNALEAALGIRAKTREINDELHNRFAPVEVDMGLNSGVGPVGMSRFKAGTESRTTFAAAGPAQVFSLLEHCNGDEFT